MTKTISKIGNSQGIIFDAALMDLAGAKLGDQGQRHGYAR
jgi:antitoxin component of MazEF toxin-antitoxin module